MSLLYLIYLNRNPHWHILSGRTLYEWIMASCNLVWKCMQVERILNTSECFKQLPRLGSIRCRTSGCFNI